MRERIIAAILTERARQDDHWGKGHRPADLVMLGVLTEEVGEVARAIINAWPTAGQRDDLEGELIQVAAVAVKWLEILAGETEQAETLPGA